MGTVIIMKDSILNEAMFCYFKLKHDIQNDTELPLAKFEIENMLDASANEIKNFVDVFVKYPLNDFLDKDGVRVQDLMTRMVYCGSIQGYYTKTKIKNLTKLIKNLAFFRDFFAVIESAEIKNAFEIIYPELFIDESTLVFDDAVHQYDINHYAQLYTLGRENPKFCIRFIPLGVLYEVSEFISRLTRNSTHADKMFTDAIEHFQKNTYRPYKASSARILKVIPDFIDDRRPAQNYLSHYYLGIRGKFFPRMIRAILNDINLNKDDIILDPFCGCGTLNVETTLLGYDSIALDINPLFTMLTEVKIKSLEFDSNKLKKDIEQLLGQIKRNLAFHIKDEKQKSITGYTATDEPFPEIKIEIPPSLMKGVNENSLKNVESILSCIELFDDKIMRDFCRIPLAYYMRSMLRKMTKEKLCKTYEEHIWQMYSAVRFFQRFRESVYNIKLGYCTVYNMDTRKIDYKKVQKDSIDAIVTSPPYLSALNYVADNAHTIYALGLSTDHLKLAGNTIGSKRIGSTKLKEDIKDKAENFKKLPSHAQDVLRKLIKPRPRVAEVYFKYFIDMQKTFYELFDVLKSGKTMVLIIGKDQLTNTNKDPVYIEIGKILEEMGTIADFQIQNVIDLGLAKVSEVGAIPTEHIIFFKKP